MKSYAQVNSKNILEEKQHHEYFYPYPGEVLNSIICLTAKPQIEYEFILNLKVQHLKQENWLYKNEQELKKK